MIDKPLRILPWIFGILIVINLLFLDFFWVKQKEVISSKKQTEPTLAPTSTIIPTFTPQLTEACGTVCLEKIQEEIKKAIEAIPTPTMSETAVSKTSPAPSIPKVVYISIGSSGSTSNTSWTDVAGTEFYFNLADYQKVKSVRWEVNLRSFLAGNAVYGRVYDVTNNRAVDGSELSTTSGTSVVLGSGDLVIWQGNNLYRVQAKSSSGNPVYLDAPRLKILLE